MAVPFDDATTFLSNEGSLIRQVYHDVFAEMYGRFGGKTNRSFKPSKRVLQGDGVNIQVRSSNMNGVRLTNDANGDFPTARAYKSDTYKVTFSETPSSNNFRRMGLSLQVTHMDINRVYTKQVSPEDFRAQLITQSIEDVAEKTALHRHLDTSSKVALVNGTAKKNDRETMTDSAAIATTGGARFAIDNGSIAALPPNLVLDIYPSGSSTKRYTVVTTDYNPSDSSVGVYGYNTTTKDGDSTIDISGIADNDELYISDERNMGLISIGEWFKAPTAGESFFGKDRTTATSRWLLPTKKGPSSNTLFTKTHIDDAMTALGYIEEDPEGGYAVLTTLELEQRYRQEIGNDVLIQYPSDEQKGKLLAGYGFDGNMYRHPTAGRMMLQADQFAAPGKIRFLRVGDWETQYPGNATFEWLVGDTGGWYRMTSSTPGNGKTTTYRMDGMLNLCDICLRPRRQVEIPNLLAS